MATAIYAFNKLQLGIESTKGTILAATRLIDCDFFGGLREVEERYRSSYPRGQRANVGGAGVTVMKGTEYTVETELTAEEILWPLLTGVLGGVSGIVTDTTAYTYTFTPELDTGVQTLDTMTLEAVMADGATNHYYGEAGYGFTTGFGISWAANQEGRLRWNSVARARQTGTPTAALTAYTSREVLATALLSVYLDTTWAGLGGTQLTGIIRSVDIDTSTGLVPKHTLEGRSDRDFAGHSVGNVTASLKVVMELDATGAARGVQDFRDNDIVFIRLKNTGSLAGAASALRTVQVDGAYRFVSPPAFSRDGEQMLVALDLESVYDPTGDETLEWTIINKLSAVT
jgi:hypothetical protein